MRIRGQVRGQRPAAGRAGRATAALTGRGAGVFVRYVRYYLAPKIEEEEDNAA